MSISSRWSIKIYGVEAHLLAGCSHFCSSFTASRLFYQLTSLYVYGYKEYIQCMYTCVHVYALKRERFFNCLTPRQAAPRTAGEKARDITQLLNCYLQVSPTAGAVMMEEETPSRSTAICTRTHTYSSGWGSPDPWMAVPPGLDGA